MEFGEFACDRHGAGLIRLQNGADVELEGEQKPSGFKVTRFA